MSPIKSTLGSIFSSFIVNRGSSQVVLVVKSSPDNAGDVSDVGLIPGLGRSPTGNGNPLQYSCLEHWPRGLWLLTQHLLSKTTSWFCDCLQVAYLQFPLLNNRDAFSYPLGVLNGGGNSHPLQYSCLGNPMDPGAWWATLHGVMKSRTRLSTAQSRGALKG